MPAILSVIVRLHNAAGSIASTLRSIAAQNPGRYEVIIVDDGSIDDGLYVARQTVEALADAGDCEFKIVSHETRRGSAAALNTGLRMADGEYVILCDADDLLEPGYYKMLLNKAAEGDYDAVVSPMTFDRDGQRRVVRPVANFDSLNELPLDTVHFSLCNKLLRREFLAANDIEAIEGADYWEDLGVFARVMALGAKVGQIDMPGYIYHSTPNSVTRRSNESIIADRIKVTDYLCRWIDERGLSRLLDRFTLQLKFYARIKYLRGATRDIKCWRSTYPEINRRMLSVPHLSIVYRLPLAILAL